MSTITEEQQEAIAKYLAEHTLSAGLGTEEAACSVAAINLALTGELTDRIPDCMSEVIGKWVIRVQDSMPANIRNSKEWKGLLPLAAGTGRQHETDRLAIVLDWMWNDVLTQLQPFADDHGFGVEWKKMTTLKTKESARAADVAADAAAYAADVADVADTATYAADAADAADAAAYAADVATYAAGAVATREGFWLAVDPVSVLRRMVELSK